MSNFLEDQEIKKAAQDIVLFASSYQFDEEIHSYVQRNQQQSKQTSSISVINSSIDLLAEKMLNENKRAQIIKNSILLHSLAKLSNYKLDIYFSYDQYQQTVRRKSRYCLSFIHDYCDQSELVKLLDVGYARVLAITIGTAGGSGDENDEDIWKGLSHIYWFLRYLHEGKIYIWKPFVQPLPLHVRMSEEQMEEEGGIEEIEAQRNNKGDSGSIKYEANRAKAATLNHFIHRQ